MKNERKRKIIKRAPVRKSTEKAERVSSNNVINLKPLLFKIEDELPDILNLKKTYTTKKIVYEELVAERVEQEPVREEKLVEAVSQTRDNFTLPVDEPVLDPRILILPFEMKSEAGEHSRPPRERKTIWRAVLTSHILIILVLSSLVVPLAAFEAHVASVTATIEKPLCDTFQTFSQGYWKNHTDQMVLPQYLGPLDVLTVADALSVFNTKTTMADKLRIQLLALKFTLAIDHALGNILDPENPIITINELVSQADDLLSQVSPPASQTALENMKNQLEAIDTAGTITFCPDTKTSQFGGSPGGTPSSTTPSFTTINSSSTSDSGSSGSDGDSHGHGKDDSNNNHDSIFSGLTSLPNIPSPNSSSSSDSSSTNSSSADSSASSSIDISGNATSSVSTTISISSGSSTSTSSSSTDNLIITSNTSSTNSNSSGSQSNVSLTNATSTDVGANSTSTAPTNSTSTDTSNNSSSTQNLVVSFGNSSSTPSSTTSDAGSSTPAIVDTSTSSTNSSSAPTSTNTSTGDSTSIPTSQ